MKTLSALRTHECSSPGPTDWSGEQSLLQSFSTSSSSSSPWTLPCGKTPGRPYWWSLRQRWHQLPHSYLCLLSLKHLPNFVAAAYFYLWILFLKHHLLIIDISCYFQMYLSFGFPNTIPTCLGNVSTSLFRNLSLLPPPIYVLFALEFCHEFPI